MASPIAALSQDDRPRERLTSLGAPALTAVELLAVLLGTGVGGRSVTQAAAALVSEADGRQFVPLELLQLRRRRAGMTTGVLDAAEVSGFSVPVRRALTEHILLLIR
jgi:DNA repair protein RadC